MKEGSGHVDLRVGRGEAGARSIKSASSDPGCEETVVQRDKVSAVQLLDAVAMVRAMCWRGRRENLALVDVAAVAEVVGARRRWSCVVGFCREVFSKRRGRRSTREKRGLGDGWAHRPSVGRRSAAKPRDTPPTAGTERATFHILDGVAS